MNVKRVDKREGRWRLATFQGAFFTVWTLHVLLLSPMLNPPRTTLWLETAGIAVKWALWVLPVIVVLARFEKTDPLTFLRLRPRALQG